MGKKYIISDERRAWLEEAKEVCARYGLVLRDMIGPDNISETSACKHYGISQHDFRRFMHKLRFDIVSNRLPNDEVDLRHMLSGYERLYVFMFGVNNLTEIPLDCDETFEEVVRTLNPRERKVIQERWLGEQYLDDVAKRLGVTRERVRQIEAKAIRRLRQPKRYRLLKYGRAKYDEFQKMREYYSKDFVSDYVSQLESDARNHIEYNDVKALYNLRDDINNYISKLKEKGVDDPRHEMTIEEMDLSVRTYNCLRKAGYKYAYELNGKTYEELIKIRNLGRKSFEEIVNKCSELGINLVEEV